MQISQDAEVEYGSALAFALTGDPSRTEALAEDLARRFPENSSAKLSYVPVLRTLAALQRGDPAKAMKALDGSEGFELGSPEAALHANFGGLYPTYVRGLALLAGKKAAEAAAEFQKVEGQRGIVLNDPVGAMARLQLARSYAMAGEKEKAKTAYADLLMLWKDADADLPLVKAARAEGR